MRTIFFILSFVLISLPTIFQVVWTIKCLKNNNPESIFRTAIYAAGMGMVSSVLATFLGTYAYLDTGQGNRCAIGAASFLLLGFLLTILGNPLIAGIGLMRSYYKTE